MKATPQRRTVVVGWRGGVGRAVIALLAQHARGRALAGARELVLVDAEDADEEPALAGARRRPPLRIGDAATLRRVLVEERADELVDLAGLDWRVVLDVCDELGVDSLGTSLERWDAPDDRDLLEDAMQLAPGRRPGHERASHVLAAGMNPGCVNALVDTALAELARRVGCEIAALGVRAILVTEHDTTDCDAPIAGFASSWSPACCLAELLTARAPWVDAGKIRTAPHAPWEAEYRVRCGDELVAGYVVPHDEIVTLSWRWPDVELAYVVRPPARARAWLEGDRRDAPTLRMWPPHARVRGRDVVGVLVCTQAHGELWCGFDNDAEAAAAFATNATLLQVAAGVLAGWHRLGERRGVHVIEELDTHAVVDDVAAILGPPKIVHDPRAPFTPLVARRS